MIAAEFDALVERQAPVRQWEPTPDELHRLFWGRDAAALGVTRDPVDVEPLVGVARLCELPGAGAARVQAATFVVQILSAGQWYDIKNWSAESFDAAIRHMQKVKGIQPHLTLRVHERD